MLRELTTEKLADVAGTDDQRVLHVTGSPPRRSPRRNTTRDDESDRGSPKLHEQPRRHVRSDDSCSAHHRPERKGENHDQGNDVVRDREVHALLLAPVEARHHGERRPEREQDSGQRGRGEKSARGRRVVNGRRQQSDDCTRGDESHEIDGEQDASPPAPPVRGRLSPLATHAPVACQVLHDHGGLYHSLALCIAMPKCRSSVHHPTPSSPLPRRTRPTQTRSSLYARPRAPAIPVTRRSQSPTICLHRPRRPSS